MSSHVDPISAISSTIASPRTPEPRPGASAPRPAGAPSADGADGAARARPAAAPAQAVAGTGTSASSAVPATVPAGERTEYLQILRAVGGNQAVALAILEAAMAKQGTAAPQATGPRDASGT